MQPDIAAVTGDIADNVELLDWLPSTLGRIKAPLADSSCWVTTTST